MLLGDSMYGGDFCNLKPKTNKECVRHENKVKTVVVTTHVHS